MPSTISLNSEHLDLITEVFEDIIKWKAHRLSDRAWNQFHDVWAPSMIEQIADNRFRLNHPTKNSLVWLQDQIKHTRVLNSSGNTKNSVPLCKTKKGIEALRVIRDAVRGQIWYDEAYRGNKFSQFFTEN